MNVGKRYSKGKEMELWSARILVLRSQILSFINRCIISRNSFIQEHVMMFDSDENSDMEYGPT